MLRQRTNQICPKLPVAFQQHAGSKLANWVSAGMPGRSARPLLCDRSPFVRGFIPTIFEIFHHDGEFFFYRFLPRQRP